MKTMIYSKPILRICLLILFSFCLKNGIAQEMKTYSEKTALKRVIDSLTKQILKDTLKFKQKDLYIDRSFNSIRNSHPYSKPYLVNVNDTTRRAGEPKPRPNGYFLDIVSGSKVKAFTDELLDIQKIDTIQIISAEDNTYQGAVILKLKPGTTYNPKLADKTLTAADTAGIRKEYPAACGFGQPRDMEGNKKKNKNRKTN